MKVELIPMVIMLITEIVKLATVLLKAKKKPESGYDADRPSK